MLTPVEPRVRLEVVECLATDTPGRWRVTWRLHNDSPEVLVLQTAWIPHGRFRGEARLSLSERVGAGDAARLTFIVSAAEAPGTLVENAFLILRVGLAGRAWRIFTRMRIEFDAQATPKPIVEVVTTQSIE
jgi:hypothetical protein